MMLELFLPYPPTENHAYRNVYKYTDGGKRYIAKKLTIKAQAWHDEASALAADVVQKSGWVTRDYKTVVEMHVVFPDQRVRDASNLFKVMLDALEKGGVYRNDRYALPRVMDFVYGTPANAGVKLKVYGIEDTL